MLIELVSPANTGLFWVVRSDFVSNCHMGGLEHSYVQRAPQGSKLFCSQGSVRSSMLGALLTGIFYLCVCRLSKL